MEPWVIALIATGGAAGYSLWSLILAYQKSMETSIKEFWSPLRTAITVIPVLCVAFIGGYNMTPDSAGDIIAVLIAGFGWAAAQSKTGINGFFKTKK